MGHVVLVKSNNTVPQSTVQVCVSTKSINGQKEKERTLTIGGNSGRERFAGTVNGQVHVQEAWVRCC